MTSTVEFAGSIELLAPLAGWVQPLAEVPDAVFAGGMAGEGLAIDPTSELLCAPCDGRVVLMGAARHALTLRTAVGDVLMHVGIDTVRLGGAGFELRVRDGEAVRAGQPLLAFDLDAVVCGAPSAITPIVLVPPAAGHILRQRAGEHVQAGEWLMVVGRVAGDASAALAVSPDGATSDAAGTAEGAPTRSRWFRVPFDHGLHARPAARVAAALTGIDAVVTLHVRDLRADARSTVALMALGTNRDQIVEARATGPGSARALEALAGLLEAAVAPADGLVWEMTSGQEHGVTPGTPSAASLAVAPATGARLPATVAVPGLVLGPAMPMQQDEAVADVAAGEPAAERERLKAALTAVRASLERLATTASGERRGLLEAHCALLEDPGLQRRAWELIAGGAGAAMAWRTTLREAGEVLAGLADARMAERRADLRDIEQQVLGVLAGRAPGVHLDLPAGAILIAEELLPSQFLALDAARLGGVCMAAGGATAHVAILAAAAGVPMLVGAGPAVLGIREGTVLAVDAEAGELWVEPDPADQRRIAAQRELRASQREADAAAASHPAATTDGTRIHVFANLGGIAEAVAAVQGGAEGCGLLRTEFLFLERARAPDADEQLAVYQAVAARLAGRPLAIRTLDAGGDKPIAYAPLPREDNPALGLRGLRTSLAHPQLPDAQLEAIARVEPAGQCRVLLPMVTDPGEVRAVRARLRAVASRLGRVAPPLGVMIETPSAALLAVQLAPEVDFFSIGSNDLAQYTLAMDRLHPILAPRLDALHPAVLRLIELAAEAGDGRGIGVAVCGALASDPEAVPVLVGLGVRELSAAPAMVARIKGCVRRIALDESAALARAALDDADAAAVRARVRAWLRERAGRPAGR
ncbi:MAG: phosphoenolpyruvate--protein phosphotransferase [Proteobacteria bacterium]|nr:phosphoenolpyruvate--protein phosphotransferase [Pseudomonadota bacterium]